MENYGVVFLKPRRVGQTWANKSMDYYNEVMGTFVTTHIDTKYTFPTIRKGHRTYELGGRQPTWNGSDTYYIMARSVEELSPYEQVYLKYRRIVSEDGPRRSGRTTQIIELALDELIRDGRTIVMDHHPHGHEHAFKQFMYLLKNKYAHLELEIEGKRDEPRIVTIING